MEELVSNSHRSKENQATKPEKKVEKVITGTAKLKKKGAVQKFADVFLSEDINNVKDYILVDVLIPAFKKAIFDIVTNGFDMLLYGEAGRTKKTSPASKVSYRSYYNRESGAREHTFNPRAGAKFGYEHSDIIVGNRRDAEEILNRMDELIESYKIASVSDLYEFAGIDGDHTDCNYGWTDISSATIVRSRDNDGWLIKMPKAIPINSM